MSQWQLRPLILRGVPARTASVPRLKGAPDFKVKSLMIFKTDFSSTTLAWVTLLHFNTCKFIGTLKCIIPNSFSRFKIEFVVCDVFLKSFFSSFTIFPQQRCRIFSGPRFLANRFFMPFVLYSEVI